MKGLNNMKACKAHTAMRAPDARKKMKAGKKKKLEGTQVRNVREHVKHVYT